MLPHIILTLNQTQSCIQRGKMEIQMCIHERKSVQVFLKVLLAVSKMTCLGFPVQVHTHFMHFPFPNTTVFQCWAESFLLVVGVPVSLRGRHSAEADTEKCFGAYSAYFLLYTRKGIR